MTSVFKVDSGRCDKRTTITAETAGPGRILIKISTNCAQVKLFGEALGELGIKDLTKHMMTNPVYVAADRTVGPECLVPCGVISAAWTEAGLVSKNLLKRYGTMSIDYVGESLPDPQQAP